MEINTLQNFHFPIPEPWKAFQVSKIRLQFIVLVLLNRLRLHVDSLKSDWRLILLLAVLNEPSTTVTSLMMQTFDEREHSQCTGN